MNTESLCISVSQVKAFMSCPRKYEYRYIRGLAPEFQPVNLAFGSSFHSMAAFLFSELKASGSVPPLEVLQQLFHESWRAAADGPLPLNSDDGDLDWEGLQATGFKMVAAFRSHFSDLKPEEVQAVEMPFTVDLHHPVTGEVLEEKLTGVIDAVLIEEGRPVVTELKTASKRYGADQLCFDVQPTAYSFAAEQFGLADAALKYVIVTKTKTPSVQVEHLRRDEHDVADLMHVVLGVLRAIDAGVSYPVRNWQCRGCQFKAACNSKP
jgi:CRISPR/Cas system-associated exonuclease Cas4 (RecB family)